MYPDLLGEFIMTLIGKGYMVSIDRDPIVDTLIIHIITYEPVPYHALRTIAFDELKCMSKDIQKIWFDSIIEWAELEFLRLEGRTKND